jgi:hypothetical protein
MARVLPDKEASLGEVLAEVSLVDVGRMVKQGATTLGCLGVFYGLIFLFGSIAGRATGFSWSKTGIPSWTIWLIIAWAVIYNATSERSFHELNLTWYFPKLGWLSSLILAAFFIGFVMLCIMMFNMEMGTDRLLVGIAVWLGYLGPFCFFLSAINLGHSRLLEKRTNHANEPH